MHTFNTRSKLELDGVNWDFEAVIGIKRLGISCDQTRGGEGGMGGREEQRRETGERKGTGEKDEEEEEVIEPQLSKTAI